MENDTLKITKAFILSQVQFPGEIEGLSFSTDGEILVLSNRGSIIVKGMPTGFYDGYDKEIYEVYVLE